MFQTHGILANYDPSTDTGSVLLHALGIIDTFLTGLPIHQALSRGQLSAGVPVVVATPDPHRLCEAAVTTLAGAVSSSSGPSGAITTQNGRLTATTDGTGLGSVTVTFSPAFVSTPTVTVSVDGLMTITISTLSNTTLTFSFTAAPNSAYGCSWTATGH